MKYFVVYFVLALFSPYVAFCAEDQGNQLLVSVNWLYKQLKQQNVVVVDTRDQASYRSLHIEGAVNIPVENTFSPPPREDLVAPLSIIQSLLSNAGISNDTQVVLYDDKETVNAARVFWVMEVYGQHRVSILNGGFSKWVDSMYPVTNQLPPIKRKRFVPEIVPDRLSTKFSTRLAITDQSKILLDARNEDEYSGKIKKFERAGHIPSALNIPTSENLTEMDGHTEIKPVNELKKLYTGLDKNKKIITYCNKGKESALTYFVLRELGYAVSAYDGSWFEWNRDMNLPIEITPRK